MLHGFSIFLSMQGTKKIAWVNGCHFSDTHKIKMTKHIEP